MTEVFKWHDNGPGCGRPRWTLEKYTTTSKGNLICLGWQPVRAKDRPKWEAEMAKRGLEVLSDAR